MFEDLKSDQPSDVDSDKAPKQMPSQSQVPKEILIILKGRIKEIGFYLNKSSAKTKKVNK